MPKPPDLTYRPRSYTTREDWTPERVRTARRQADQGNLLLAADLFEAMRTDDRIAGVLGTRVRGLIKSPLRFEPHEGDQPTPETTALETDFWRAFPENDLADLMTWGLGVGVGIAEQVWELSGGRFIPRLRVWSPRWLRWDHDHGAWYLSTTTGDVRIGPTDPKWLVYQPGGAAKAWRGGLWLGLSGWWLLKRFAQLDWGSYSEAHGNPLRVGTTPDGSSRADRDELASDLQAVSGVTGIALPAGFDIKMVEATANSWETFERQIEAANAGISVTIAGQTLTTEVKGGSLAAAQVHETIRGDMIASDEQTFSTALHEQSIRAWTLINFGNADRAPWARWDTTPPENVEETAAGQKVKAEAMQALAVAVGAWLDLGVPLDVDVLAEEYNLPRAVVRGLTQRMKATEERPRVALASGDRENIGGFVRGQMYADRLVRNAAPLARMSGTLQALADLIRQTDETPEGLEVLRERLLRIFDEVEPDMLAGLEEAIVLADLAGRRAVVEDL